MWLLYLSGAGGHDVCYERRDRPGGLGQHVHRGDGPHQSNRVAATSQRATHGKAPVFDEDGHESDRQQQRDAGQQQSLPSPLTLTTTDIVTVAYCGGRS